MATNPESRCDSAQHLWIPGSRLKKARPGMTNEWLFESEKKRRGLLSDPRNNPRVDVLLKGARTMAWVGAGKIC
jgi:hypothetical protein